MKFGNDWTFSGGCTECDIAIYVANTMKDSIPRTSLYGAGNPWVPTDQKPVCRSRPLPILELGRLSYPPI